MLTIIEQQDIILNFYPDLGLGHILGSCKQANIKTHLVEGSVRFLKNILVYNPEQIISLVLNQPSLTSASKQEKDSFAHISTLIKYYGDKNFKDYLGNLYIKSISNNMGVYLNKSISEEISKVVQSIFSILKFYVHKIDSQDIFFIKDLYNDIMKAKPSMIAFSVWDPNNVFIQETIKLLKQKTDIPVVVGGPFSIFYDPKKIFGFFNPDFVMRGLADNSFPMLYNQFREDKINVPGIIQNKHGRIIVNNDTPNSDFNSLPKPDFSKFSLDKYYSPVKVLPLQTSRGCAWRKCAFCGHHAIYGNKYQALKINTVLDLIDDYKKKYDVSFIHFHDEFISPKRFKQISEGVINKGWKNKYFYAYARAEKSFSDEILNVMYKAGFRALFFGIESGSQRVLDSMKKGTNVKDNEDLLKRAHNIGFANLVWTLFGFPTETSKEADQTVDFLVRNKQYVDFVILHHFHLSKYSPIYDNPAQWGVTILNSQNYQVKNGLSQKKMMNYVKTLNEKSESGDIVIRNNRFVSGYELVFLQSCFEKLSKEDAKKEIVNVEIFNLYPIFVGALENDDQNYFFKPRIFSPDKKRDLTYSQYLVCSLSDGSRTVKEVVNSVQDATPSLSQKQIMDFFQDLNDKNFIHFFKKEIK